MPKYTISIADIEIRVTTDESPEMVDTLVDTLDRRIRDIIAKSPRCTKSEAAILCALDLCADSLKGGDDVQRAEQAAAALKKELGEVREAHTATLTQLEQLRRENEALRALVGQGGASMSTITPPRAEKPAPKVGYEQLTLDMNEPDLSEELTADTAEPKEAEQPIASIPATEVMFNSENETEVTPHRARRTTRARSSANKSKVGDMFDMLTFKDI